MVLLLALATLAAAGWCFERTSATGSRRSLVGGFACVVATVGLVVWGVLA